MATYPVNLPLQLQQEALQWATDQGIALDDFILWVVAEKIVELKHQFSDRTFTNVAYRQGASGGGDWYSSASNLGDRQSIDKR